MIQDCIVNATTIAGELREIDHQRSPGIAKNAKTLYHQYEENSWGYDAIRVSKLSSVGLQYKIPQVTITSVGIASFDQGPTRKFFGTQSKYPFRLPSGTRIHGCLGSTNEDNLM